jgi:hypothetical protein
VDHDIRILGERNERNSAINREEWRKHLKKARPMYDCRANDDDEEKDKFEISGSHGGE